MAGGEVARFNNMDFSRSGGERVRGGSKEKTAERRLIQKSLMAWIEEGNSVTICRPDQSEHLDKQCTRPSPLSMMSLSTPWRIPNDRVGWTLAGVNDGS